MTDADSRAVVDKIAGVATAAQDNPCSPSSSRPCRSNASGAYELDQGMTDGAASEPVSDPHQPPTCYRHPDRESHVQCSRCGRYICPDCMVEAPVGFHCPECVRDAPVVSCVRQDVGWRRRSSRTPYSLPKFSSPSTLCLWPAAAQQRGADRPFLDVGWLRLRSLASGGDSLPPPSCTAVPRTCYSTWWRCGLSVARSSHVWDAGGTSRSIW